MEIVDYRYLKVNKGVATMARIQLEIQPNNTEANRIIIDSEHIPFVSQGYIDGGYKNWNDSAKKALEIALNKITHPFCLDIVIKKLEGRELLDTNNASIGIACILGLWEYLEIQPTNKIMDKCHHFIQEDWKNDVDVIPNFKLIFEN